MKKPKCYNCGDNTYKLEEGLCPFCYDNNHFFEPDEQIICDHISTSNDNEGFQRCDECGESY